MSTDRSVTTVVAPEPVLTEVRDGVLIVTLNRPHARNAIDSALTAGIVEAVRRLESDPALSVGVLTGAGGVFCSGMDLKAFASEGMPNGLDQLLRLGSAKPLIGAVESFALAGGLELALICDLLVAGESASFGIPEVKVGLFAAGGALIRLPSRLPRSVVSELALTGDPIPAARALDLGLINRVVPDGGALDAAVELAARISRNAPLATAASKQIIQATAGRTEDDLWELQVPLIKSVFRSADAAEGPRAFAEKRRPRWSAS